MKRSKSSFHEFQCKTYAIFQTTYDCKDTVLIVPAVYGKSVNILHDTAKLPAMKAGDSCGTSKSILYRTRCNVFQNKHANFPKFSP